MINELWQLASVLEQENIKTREWHRHYKELPKNLSVRLWLNPDGSIHGCEALTKDQVSVIRKYEPDNGKSFPAFNIYPLYRITDSEKISQLAQIEKDPSLLDWQEIKSWCTVDVSNWSQQRINTYHKCLETRPKELRKLIPPELEQNSVVQLFDILTTYQPEPGVTFQYRLESFIFEQLRKKEDVNIALALLIHKGNPAKDADKDTGKPITIILDIYDWEKYGEYPIVHEKTTEWINELLLNSEKLGGDSEADLIDAFGVLFKNPSETMPKVKLGGLSEVTLRSMYRGHPCQSRYQKFDDESYPISKVNRSRIKSALETLFQDDKKGIFWSYLNNNELLFIYPSKIPKVPVAFAKLAAPTEKEDRFTAIAKEFSKTMRGIPSAEKPESIRIFVLRKMDKARTKVIYQYYTNPDYLLSSAEKWEVGCNNVPELRWARNRCTPFPAKVPDILNNVWKQDGTLAQGKRKIERMKYYQGIELLLDSFPYNALQNYQRTLLANASGLITYIGNTLHGGGYDQTKIPYCADICTVLGLLLYKCGEYKETYMNNQAYLIGQLLHISDELHAHYCRVVRDGGMPAQFVGSALLVTAQETPVQALSLLSTRMTPYIAWAKQYRFKNISENGKESWKAGWYLRLYQETADKLVPVFAEKTRLTDIDRAQLFLGYLASFPKKEETTEYNTGENNEN